MGSPLASRRRRSGCARRRAAARPGRCAPTDSVASPVTRAARSTGEMASSATSASPALVHAADQQRLARRQAQRRVVGARRRQRDQALAVEASGRGHGTDRASRAAGRRAGRRCSALRGSRPPATSRSSPNGVTRRERAPRQHAVRGPRGVSVPQDPRVIARALSRLRSTPGLPPAASAAARQADSLARHRLRVARRARDRIAAGRRRPLARAARRSRRPRPSSATPRKCDVAGIQSHLDGAGRGRKRESRGRSRRTPTNSAVGRRSVEIAERRQLHARAPGTGVPRTPWQPVHAKASARDRPSTAASQRGKQQKQPDSATIPAPHVPPDLRQVRAGARDRCGRHGARVSGHATRRGRVREAVWSSSRSAPSWPATRPSCVASSRKRRPPSSSGTRTSCPCTSSGSSRASTTSRWSSARAPRWRSCCPGPVRCARARAPTSASRSAGRWTTRTAARGIVHRDVTPRNVLVDEEGAVRLIDFGIAAPALVPAGEAAGSPGDIRIAGPHAARAARGARSRPPPTCSPSARC